MPALRARTYLMAAAILALGWWAWAAAQNRNALREIVERQCVVQWQETHSAGPCVRVVMPDADGEKNGYALLADRKGGAHFLLIPTRAISGIESPDLLDPKTPNYFAAAWSAREELAGVVGRRLPRDVVGMAVNSRHARSQDQLHIHLECLQPTIAASLRASADRLTDDWIPIEVPGWHLFATRVMGENLAQADPFKLLAGRLAGAKDALGDYSLLVAGMAFQAGPGFVLLAGTGPGTELLLDSSCAVAKP
jgi:CDP-diacylglycerol pyrophosphatase